MKILAAVLIVTAIWILLATPGVPSSTARTPPRPPAEFLLASLREGRHRSRAAVDANDVWMIEQHDPVVRLGQQAALPPDHPLARLSTAPTSRRG